MNKLLLSLLVLISISANAGRAKLNFTHDNRAIDGTTVVLTAFNVYWGMTGQPVSNVIPLGPPALLPWKVENGNYFYARTLDNVNWTPGSTVCFQMTAIAQSEESARSNQICKRMPSDPTTPVIIDIDTP